MFSFSTFRLLLENLSGKRQAFLEKKYEDKFRISHETFGALKDGTASTDHKEVVKRIMSHDPDQKKFSNSDWMAHQYSKQAYRQEDLPRVRDQVAKFHEVKNQQGWKSNDLGKFALDSNQGKHDLRHELRDHDVRMNKAASEDSKFPDGPRFENHPGAEKIHDDGKGTTIHVLHTHEAGRAARASCGHEDESGGWCFGWKTPSHFNGYSQQGPIHLIQTPDNKKHALHFPSGQFMDKDDGAVHAHDLVKKYPSLVGARLNTTNHTDEPNSMDHVMPFLSERGKKHQIEHDFEAGDESSIQYHKENHPELITKANTHEAIEHYKNGNIRASIVHNLPHITQDHIDHIWEQERIYNRNTNTPIHKELTHITQNPEHLHEMNSPSLNSPHIREVAGERLHREFGQFTRLTEKPPYDVSEIHGHRTYHNERLQQHEKSDPSRHLLEKKVRMIKYHRAGLDHFNNEYEKRKAQHPK